MAWTRDWLEANPVDHTQFQDQPGHVRQHKVDISDRLKDMIYGFTSGETETDEGFKKVPLRVQASDPTNEANKIIVYAKDVNSKAEIFFEDEDANVFQVTTAGKLNLVGSLLPNDTFVVGRDNADSANVNLFKINTSDVLVLMDGAQLETSGAPTNDADIANKKYIDDNIMTDRGDPSSADFTQATLTFDNTWRDMDLSSIVTAGRTFVYLRVRINNATAGRVLDFREKGNSNAFNVLSGIVAVNGQSAYFSGWVRMDSSRVIQYRGSGSISTAEVTVGAWK